MRANLTKVQIVVLKHRLRKEFEAWRDNQNEIIENLTEGLLNAKSMEHVTLRQNAIFSKRKEIIDREALLSEHMRMIDAEAEDQ